MFLSMFCQLLPDLYFSTHTRLLTCTLWQGGKTDAVCEKIMRIVYLKMNVCVKDMRISVIN